MNETSFVVTAKRASCADWGRHFGRGISVGLCPTFRWSGGGSGGAGALPVPRGQHQQGRAPIQLAVELCPLPLAPVLGQKEQSTAAQFLRSLTRPALQKDGMPEVAVDLVQGHVKAGCLRSWRQAWKPTSKQAPPTAAEPRILCSHLCREAVPARWRCWRGSAPRPPWHSWRSQPIF